MLDCKDWKRLERLARDKHCSLFSFFVGNEEKKFFLNCCLEVIDHHVCRTKKYLVGENEKKWRHDIQYNDVHHDDIQHTGYISILSITLMGSVDFLLLYLV
jgi:hypothetical protein